MLHRGQIVCEEAGWRVLALRRQHGTAVAVAYDPASLFRSTPQYARPAVTQLSDGRQRAARCDANEYRANIASLSKMPLLEDPLSAEQPIRHMPTVRQGGVLATLCRVDSLLRCKADCLRRCLTGGRDCAWAAEAPRRARKLRAPS